MRAEDRVHYLGSRKSYGIQTLYLVFVIGFCSIQVKAIQDNFEGISSNGSSFQGISSYGSSLMDSKEDSFAEIIDRALEKEFSDKDEPDGESNTSYIMSIALKHLPQSVQESPAAIRYKM